MYINLKNTVRLVAIVAAMVLCPGCTALGFLLTPGPNERPKPAEFDLQRELKGNVLIMVDIAGTLVADADLKERLTARIAGFLVKKVRLSDRQIIPYIPESTALSREDPAQLAQRLGAEMILYTRVLDYEMQGFQGGKYYTGLLVSRTALLGRDSAVLWPAGSEAREVQVSVDIETAGRDKALDRLANAAAHCITRALYNCPRSSFGISEERLSLREMTED